MGTLIRTIETDPVSPFGEPEVPPAEWTYRDACQDAYRRGPDYAMAWVMRVTQGGTRLPEFPKHASLERKVYAHVNHSRWLWDCPLCNAAQVCSNTDWRALCVECFNRGDGWWEVVWPDERAQIEELLSRRPRDDQRNWYPNETLDMLQLENLSIGVESDGVKGLPDFPGSQDALAVVRKYQGELVGAPAQKELE